MKPVPQYWIGSDLQYCSLHIVHLKSEIHHFLCRPVSLEAETSCTHFSLSLSLLFLKTISFTSSSRLDKVLATVVRERRTDLVIIEGMGRAIHTNYYAALSCESLKLAVIKNSWLADRLGGKIFSVVFKFEVPPKTQGLH